MTELPVMKKLFFIRAKVWQMKNLSAEMDRLKCDLIEQGHIPKEIIEKISYENQIYSNCEEFDNQLWSRTEYLGEKGEQDVFYSNFKDGINYYYLKIHNKEFIEISSE